MKPALQYLANSVHDILSRGMRAMGGSLDTKRPRAWEEYGYPEVVSFDQLYTMWRRGGMAHGAVERIVDRCWSSNPWLLEGTKKQDDKKETEWEVQQRKYAKAIGLWPAFRDADRKRLVGGYSALLLEAPGEWNTPLRGKTVLGVRAIWRSQLRPATYNTMNSDVVTTWEYKSLDGRVIRKIHADRVFILGDYADPLSFIEPAYNYLLNLEKICGGVAEGTLKNAARQLALEFAEGSSLSDLATSMNKNTEETQDLLNNMAKDLNSGIDVLFALSGGKITPIVAQVPDPVGPNDVNVQQATAAWRIPAKILIGNQTGERASTEDKRDFDALCQGRNTTVVFPEIEAFFNHLVRVRAFDQMPVEWMVYGEDLTESSAAEKLANAKTISEINKNGEAGGPTFTADEIRTTAGFEALPDGRGELPDEDDEPEDDELIPDPSA